MAYRSPGYGSNAAMIADRGKYQTAYPDDEGSDDVNDQDKLHAEQTIADVLRRNERVLIAGGKSGFYQQPLYREDRFVWLESTEASKDQLDYKVPSHVGAIVLTKFMTFDLQRTIKQQALHRNIPVFGALNSPGAVNRLLFGALNRLTVPVPVVVSKEDIPVAQSRLKVIRVDPPAAPPDPAPLPSSAAPTGPIVAPDVLSAFAEVEAALSLLRDAVLTIAQDAEANKRDAEMLRSLKGMLKG